MADPVTVKFLADHPPAMLALHRLANQHGQSIEAAVVPDCQATRDLGIAAPVLLVRWRDTGRLIAAVDSQGNVTEA